MPKIIRPRHEFPTPAFRVAVPLAPVVAAAAWSASVTEKPWLFASVMLAVGVLATPLLLRLRHVGAIVVAAVVLTVVAWMIGFVVWASFVHWE